MSVTVSADRVDTFHFHSMTDSVFFFFFQFF